MKLVSVVVPVFNAELYLAECIDSILAQSYGDVEVLLIDDGSSDGSGEICDEYALLDQRVIVIHQNNSGVSSARNAGIAQMSGEYVTFVDADDTLEQDAIASMVTLINEHAVDCVRTTYRTKRGKTLSGSGLGIQTGLYDVKSMASLTKDFISGTEGCYVFLLMINRSALPSSVRFDEDVSMMEDTCFYIKLLTTIENIYISDVVTYVYRENPGSVSRSSQYYFTNALSVIEVNRITEQALAESRYADYGIQKFANINHVVIVSNYMFLLFKASRESRKQVRSLFVLLRNNDAFSNMIKESDIESLALHHRYAIRCLQLDAYRPLYVLLMFRLVVNKLKSAATTEREYK